MLRTIAILLTLASASIGCAEITYDSRELRRTVLRTELTQTLAGVRATARQSGALVEGEAVELCDSYQQKEVRRTLAIEPKNNLLPGDLIGLAFGVAFAGLGSAYLVDANSVYPADPNSRLYNSSGPSEARAGGGVLVALGGLIMLGPVIDLVRTASAQPSQKVDVIKERGPVVERSVPCVGGKVAVNEPVTGRVGSAKFALGSTGPDGRFSVDIRKKVSSAEIHSLGDPARMQIWVGNGKAGEVELTPLVAAQQEPGDEALTPRPPAQLAVSPEDATQSEGAVKLARKACQQACVAACSSKAACVDACAAGACK